MATGRSRLPQLVEVNGPFAGRVHELAYGVHIVGRGAEASIRLDHEDVSRRHAQLDVGPNGVMVRDLGSKNGVAIEGRKVIEPCRLGHAQQLSFGDLVLTLSHPAAMVGHALAQAGETTATATAIPDGTSRRGSGLVIPMVGVLLFGALVVALMYM